jgi:L-ribulose-5-phosphate 3-epimerase
MNSLDARLAVCSWSLQPESPDRLVDHLLEIGIRRVQLALDPVRENPKLWGDTFNRLKAVNIQVVSGMMTTVGEDYSTLETIQLTGGVVPDGTWDQNWANFQRIAQIAGEMQLKLVTFHAGFLPHDSKDPNFAKLRHRIEQIADLFSKHEIDLGFETGQETATSLATFLKDLGRPNVGVNFDPANMLLYNQGNPVAAVQTLAPWLKQVHLKDANRTKVPGTWGEEVPVGRGEVEWPAFFEALGQSGFKGDLCFEREAGEHRVGDIRAGLEYIRSLGIVPR